jgi:hypothetical protein
MNSLTRHVDILYAVQAFFQGDQKIYDALFQSKQLGFIA